MNQIEAGMEVEFTADFDGITTGTIATVSAVVAGYPTDKYVVEVGEATGKGRTYTRVVVPPGVVERA